MASANWQAKNFIFHISSLRIQANLYRIAFKIQHVPKMLKNVILIELRILKYCFHMR